MRTTASRYDRCAVDYSHREDKGFTIVKVTPRKRRWRRKVMKRVGFISNFETRDLTDDSFVSVVSMQDEM
jgi:hypothetical protein